MLEVFFRVFFKFFFFFSFLFYIVFFVVLGYRFDFLKLEKKDSFLQLIGWYDEINKNIKVDNNSVKLSKDGIINFYYLNKGCYDIKINEIDRFVCLDSNQYLQYIIIDKVLSKKVNFVDKNSIDWTFYDDIYSNNCIDSYNKCFDENIIGVYKIKDLKVVKTYSSIYLCSYDFKYCKKIFDKAKDKYIIDFTKKGIYLIDKNSNLYLLQIE